MACCLTAPSHYLNQCLQIISEVLWLSPNGCFTRNAKEIYAWYESKNFRFHIRAASPRGYWVCTLRPRQNGHYFPDDIFKCIFLNENIRISTKISLKLVPNVPINNITALVQTMAWRCPGDKPLSEPMEVNLLTHICVTRRQWINPPATEPGIFNENFADIMVAEALLLASPTHQHLWYWVCKISCHL